MTHTVPQRNFDTPRHPILVVDGDAARRDAIARELRGLGWQAVATGDMFYVLALMASDAAVRTLMLNTDWSADFSANTLLAQAHSLRPMLPIVLYSSEGKPDLAREPATPSLIWPCSAKTLSAACDQAAEVAASKSRRPPVVAVEYLSRPDSITAPAA